MSMNEFLAQYYATNAPLESEKTAAEVDAGEQEKIAMFAKLAKENNIDLSSLSDEKIEALYNQTFDKSAGEMPPQFMKKEEKGEEKKDEKKEEEEKKAAAAAEEARLEKQAQEADFMGRIMAHAYVNEMRKIAADVEAKTASAKTETAAPSPEVKTASIRERLLKLAEKDEKPEEKKEEKGDDKKEKSLPPWMKDKEASALNEAAVEQALGIIQEYNKQAAANQQPVMDVKVAAERLSAVHTLGAPPTEKVASAANAEAAQQIRALEYLEWAGYPVNWSV